MCIRDRSGFAHVAMDYRKLLQNGVEGIRQQLAAAKAALQPQDPEYAEKLAFYQAEEELCQGMLALAQRYAALAREKAQAERYPTRRQELLTMAAVLDLSLIHIFTEITTGKPIF